MADQLQFQEPKASFNIQDIIEGLGRFIFGPNKDSNRRDALQRDRQDYGPSYAPPVSEDIAGYGVKRITPELGLENFRPQTYYEKPGVGVNPSMTKPARGFYEPDVAAEYEPETKQHKRRK